MRRDETGKYRFKIVLYGPSLSGKTTMLRWLHSKAESAYKGDLTSIEDETNRTMFFDYAPISTSGRVIFDIFTVAGQKQHSHQRKVVIKDADSIVFVVDSSRRQRDENIYAFNELRELLGKRLGDEVKLVVVLNKQDAKDKMTNEEIIGMLGIGTDTPVYETVAITGKGVKRAFQAVMHDVITSALHRSKNEHIADS